MLPKQVAYILFGIILLLSVLFGFSIYTNYQKKTYSEDKISNIISKFEEKFKNDSIYLANANKLLIDRISQHILDSVSSSYEKKLEVALNNADKYKRILIENNIDFKHINNTNKKNNFTDLNNISTQNNTIIATTQKQPVNVTTYSKLNKTNSVKPKISNINNVTTYSKINNVTTYTEIYNTSKNNYKSNVVTYSNLNITKRPSKTDKTTQINTSYNKVTNSKLSNKNYFPKIKSSNRNLTHDNTILDTAENLNDIDFVPVYRGCEKLLSEKEKKNCFAIKISKHILNNFNTTNLQSIGLKKGINKVRVLFIIDKNGVAKTGKLVGKWHHQIYENVKYAVESTPKMKPGYNKNKPVPIKYSLLIPFIIK